MLERRAERPAHRALHGVNATRIVQDVAGPDNVEIVARAADQRIAAGVADQRIVACESFDGVVAGSAEKTVVTTCTHDACHSAESF